MNVIERRLEILRIMNALKDYSSMKYILEHTDEEIANIHDDVTSIGSPVFSDMRINDLRLNSDHPIAYLHGKGGKTRTVPLLPNTVQHCKRYLKKFHSDEPADSEKYMFYTMIHGTQNRMSHDNAADFIKRYGLMAAQKCAEIPKHLHPHMLRHTRAMHLYRNGMPLELLSQFLGHTSVDTTRIYAYADTEMKRAALEKINSQEQDSKTSIAIWENDEDMILRLSGLL